MRKQRKHYTPEEKVAILRQHFRPRVISDNVRTGEFRISRFAVVAT
jgi:hypothetical protein